MTKATAPRTGHRRKKETAPHTSQPHTSAVGGAVTILRIVIDMATVGCMLGVWYHSRNPIPSSFQESKLLSQNPRLQSVTARQFH